MTERFQVDLRGVVELLSRHLYSSPRVFVRELAQNGVDAVTARSALDPQRGADPRPDVLFVVRPDGVLDCWDSGVGLTPGQIEEFLSTIGSSSKRDELGFQRENLLGQFGIGLLSAFMVTDRIEVVSRSAERGSPVVRWVGSSDGTYARETLGRTRRLDPDQRAWLDRGPGTCVRLFGDPRATWTQDRTVLDLAREYLSYLPQHIAVQTLDGATHPISPTPPPWQGDAAQQDRAAQLLGLPAFATVPLRVEEAGLEGVAVVSDRPLDARRGHQVYLRGMLVGADVAGIAPDWAVFCRCIVTADRLRPTASREALYDDDLTAAVRTAVGEQLMRWLRRLAEVDPTRMAAFLRIHQLALKAAATTDSEIRDLLLPLLPFESTYGVLPLREIVSRSAGRAVSYVASVDDYRQIAPLARAQGLAVVNAGYVYEAELLAAWVSDTGAADVVEMTPRDLAVHLAPVDEAVARQAAGFLATAEDALAAADVSVELRSYAPATMPALLLDDAGSRRGRDHRSTQDSVDDALAALLASVAPAGDHRPRLALNHQHDQVRRLLAVSDPERVAVAARTLYVRALLAGNRPLRPVDSAIVESAFETLLEMAVGPTSPEGAPS